jgi:hypothetical protein
MNKAGVAVAGFRCKSRKIELLEGISLDPLDDLIKNMGVQVATRLAVLCRNAAVSAG